MHCLRNKQTFDRLYENAKVKVKSAERMDEELGSVCVRVRTNEKDFIDNNIVLTYLALFYEIIDNIIQQITDRFADNDKLLFLGLLEQTRFEEYSKIFPNKMFNNLFENYKNLFQKDKLKNELEIFYSDEQFRKISSLQEIIRLIYKNRLHDILSEVYKLLCLIATLPSTSVSVERNFSALKRIKNYLRNSIKQDRLNSLALMSIEKSLLNKLYSSSDFYDEVTRKFVLKSNRRIDFIYKT